MPPDDDSSASFRREIAPTEGAPSTRSLGCLATYHNVGRFESMDSTPERPSQRRADVVDAELVGGVEKRELVLADYDPAWADEYREHEQRIRQALGPFTRVEHIG